MRRLSLILIAALAALTAAPAAARCAGADLMARLAAQDPQAHAAILARAAEVPNGEGLLWRIAPAVAGRAPSWLFGTIHSTEAARRGLPGPVRAALDAADRVYIETSPAEQAEMQARLRRDPSFVQSRSGATLSGRLPPERLAEARAALAARGMALPVADRMAPWFLLAVLAVPDCERRAIAAGAPLLDNAIAEDAARRRLPVRGLERYEASIEALGALSEPVLRALLLEAVVALPDEEDIRRTMEGLYAEERVAALAEFTIWNSERLGLQSDSRAAAAAFAEVLLARRNRAWMGTIAQALRRGGAFIAVGALHLPGEDGLVALLRRRGIEVARVPLAP